MSRPTVRPLLTIVRALMEAPRTVPELINISGLGKAAAYRHIHVMHDMKMVKPAGYGVRKRPNRAYPMIWELVPPESGEM